MHDLVERLRAAEKQIEAVRVQQLLSSAGDLAAGARDVVGVRVRQHRHAGRRRRRARCARSRSTCAGGSTPAGRAWSRSSGSTGGKPAVVVTVNDAARDRGLSANALVKVAAGVLGGSGGGRDDVAQGGGAAADGTGAEPAASGRRGAGRGRARHRGCRVDRARLSR